MIEIESADLAFSMRNDDYNSTLPIGGIKGSPNAASFENAEVGYSLFAPVFRLSGEKVSGVKESQCN